MTPSETYEFMKKISREKKLSNKKSSTLMLDEMGIKYESKNNGIHLIIYADGKFIDFYPSTGKWIPRGQKAKRGVKKLLAFIESSQNDTQ